MAAFAASSPSRPIGENEPELKPQAILLRVRIVSLDKSWAPL